MKMILIIGLMGIISLTGYAQDKSCSCKKKTAYNTHHRKTVVSKTVVVNQEPSYSLYINTEPAIVAAPLPATKSCAIDKNGDIRYTTSDTYLGYYSDNHSDCDMYEGLATPYKDLSITSTAFNDYGALPAKYTCQGQAISPPLGIANIPDATKSLAIIMFDPYANAKKSTTYWLMWDIDTTGVIPENFITDHMSQNPESQQYGYQGVCPVGGDIHYYHFRVYALDAKLQLDRHTNQADLEGIMRGHILAKGELVGRYSMRVH